MQATANEPQAAGKPGIIETLGVLIVCQVAAILVTKWAGGFLRGPWAIWAVWLSHGVMFLAPWAWYRLRVVPALPAKPRPLWRWVPGSGRLFWICFLPLFGLQVLNAAFSRNPLPPWMHGGWPAVTGNVLFQGLWVGFSEEMMIRPALQTPLRLCVPGDLRLGRFRLSWSILLTAVLFGSLHFSNMLNGISLINILPNVAFATVVGISLGYYYERTQNYLGNALLHNLLDIMAALLLPLLFAP